VESGEHLLSIPLIVRRIIFYVGNITIMTQKKTPKKTTTKKKQKITNFFDVILAQESQRTNYPDRMGKGVVRGKDVSRIRDALNSTEKN